MQFETRVALAGLRLKSAPEDVRSLPLQGAGIVTDGSAVAISDDGETCTAVTGVEKEFGIVVFQHIGKSGRTADGKSEAYAQYDVVPVMTKGRIWVRPDGEVTKRGKTEKVYVTAEGKLTAVEEGNTELVGAFWDVPNNSDGLAVVDLG